MRVDFSTCAETEGSEGLYNFCFSVCFFVCLFVIYLLLIFSEFFSLFSYLCQYQLRWGDREMGTAISCTECSQVAGLPCNK